MMLVDILKVAAFAGIASWLWPTSLQAMLDTGMHKET